MNWIKITQETELPKPGALMKEEEGLMLKHINNSVYLVCILVSNKGRLVFISGFQEWLPFSDFTHYCVISSPEE